jgi:hypothetical protein
MKLGWPSLISCIDSLVGPTIIFSLNNYFGPCKLGSHHIDYHNNHWFGFVGSFAKFHSLLCNYRGHKLLLNGFHILCWIVWAIGVVIEQCMTIAMGITINVMILHGIRIVLMWVNWYFLKSWQVWWILLVSGHFRMMYL